MVGIGSANGIELIRCRRLRGRSRVSIGEAAVFAVEEECADDMAGLLEDQKRTQHDTNASVNSDERRKKGQ
ncbi:hypothetical protein D7S89_16015 [Trinickia fusca]|uniref:Uncharacterized protein n=1 Tax=Trinickia fusca TaxID=2419777 RepID=A0A494X9N8_9BURK|nr:hypothetical protein D7S89_16015 [Trinickia fusca]